MLQDRGVLAVIFSVLAVAFLFEIDDKLMEVFETMGWTESAFYEAKLRPMLQNFVEEENREIIEYQAVTKSNRTVGEWFRGWWARGLKQPSLWGRKTLRFWAFLLVTALFAVHQDMVFILATSTGTQSEIKKQYNSIFYEWGSDEIGGGYQIAFLCGGIYVAVFLNTLCFHGVSCLGNTLQLGVCLVWTYATFREVVINGLLVWYADLRPDQTVGSHIAQYLFVWCGLGDVSKLHASIGTSLSFSFHSNGSLTLLTQSGDHIKRTPLGL